MLPGLCYLVCVLVAGVQLSEVIQQFFIQLLVFVCCVSFVLLLFIILSQTRVPGRQLNTWRQINNIQPLISPDLLS